MALYQTPWRAKDEAAGRPVRPRSLAVPRVVRFAIVGLACGVVQLALLRLLMLEGAWSWPANLAAFIASAQFNFSLNSLVTWGDRTPALGLGSRWLQFMLGIASTGALNLAVFAAVDAIFPTMIAAATGIAIAASANYFYGNALVFRNGASLADESER